MEQIQRQNRNQNQNQGRKQKYKKNLPKDPIQTQNEDQNINNLCPLCKDHTTEISMPCAGMHSYCFSCIKKWFVSKKELSCPECRKTCESVIKIPNDKNKFSVEFSKFLESVKIIPNPLRHDEDCKCFQNYFDNTCIYPNWSLVHFVENKEQLELYYESIENPKYKDKIDELTKLIKWSIYDEDEKHSHHRHHNHT